MVFGVSIYFHIRVSSRAHGQLGAELLRLEVTVDKELDDAGGVLLDHDLAAEPAFLVVGVHDTAHLLDGVGNLGEKIGSSYTKWTS
jgi:hypothetical protein